MLKYHLFLRNVSTFRPKNPIKIRFSPKARSGMPGPLQSRSQSGMTYKDVDQAETTHFLMFLQQKPRFGDLNFPAEYLKSNATFYTQGSRNLFGRSRLWCARAYGLLYRILYYVRASGMAGVKHLKCIHLEKLLTKNTESS